MKRLAFAVCLSSLPTPLLAEVSFSDILNDPDNIDLNQAFIDERIQAGDLPPALSAVERIIQLQPLNVGARILRAQLLISMGNLAIAKTEIDALDRYRLPENQQREVERLSEQLASQLNRWTTRGALSMTADYDSNVGAITDTGTAIGESGEILTSFDSEGFSNKRSDTALGLTASVTSSYDLGTQTRDSAYIQVVGKKTNGDTSDLKNLHSISTTIGTQVALGSYSTNTFMTYQRIHRNTVKNDGTAVKRDDIDTVTVGTQFGRQYGSNNVQIGYSYAMADYSGRSATSDLSDSRTHGVSFGLFRLVDQQTALFSNISYQQRRASDRNVPTAVSSQDRNVTGVTLGTTKIFGDYHRMTGSVAYRNLAYRQRLAGSDQFIRDDRETTLALNYQFDAQAISADLDGWSFFANASRIVNNSNMASYDITNNYLTVGISVAF